MAGGEGDALELVEEVESSRAAHKRRGCRIDASREVEDEALEEGRGKTAVARRDGCIEVSLELEASRTAERVPVIASVVRCRL